MLRTTLIFLAVIVLVSTVGCADSVEQASKITPVNPVFTTADRLEVVENTTFVGILEAIDPASSAKITFRLVPNKYNFDKFLIDSDGKTLRFVQSPDYEDINQRAFSVQIEANTKPGAKSTLDISVTVINDNDTAPIIDTSLANFSISENSVLLSEIIGTDPDDEQTVIDYLLDPLTSAIPVGGEPGADQSLFEIIDVEGKFVLAFVSPPDYEASTTYNLTLYASDAINLGFLKIRVDLIDVPVSSPNVTLTADVKRIIFNWQLDSEAIYYEVWKDTDGLGSAFSYKKIASNLPNDALQYSLDIAVHNVDWLNVLYMIKACDKNGQICAKSSDISPKDYMLESIGNLTGMNTEATDKFGSSISVSRDGSTIAVGARWESSSLQGVCNTPSVPENGVITCSNTTFTDNDWEARSGAVYIFRKNVAGFWFLEAYIKSKNSEGFTSRTVDTGGGDMFGSSVSLSANGRLLAVGAPREDGSSKSGSFTGPFGPDAADTICADPTTNKVIEDNCSIESGAVYVFNRNAKNLWIQEAYLKDGLALPQSKFGTIVDLSADGNNLAVGSVTQRVLVFYRYSIGNWNKPQVLQASNTGAGDKFSASSLSLSGNGTTIAIGAPYEDGSFTGICNGLNIPSAIGQLSCEITNATIINNDLLRDSGSVYIYTREQIVTSPTVIDNKWSQVAFLKASNADISAYFGASVSLNNDGTILAVGSIGETGVYKGVCNVQGIPDPVNSTLCFSGIQNQYSVGAVYMFTYDTLSKWTQQAYVKPANNKSSDLIGDNFGSEISLSGDGRTLVVGSPNEDGAFNGVNYGPGAPDDILTYNECNPVPSVFTIENNCTTDAGAIYVFSADSANKWQQHSYVKAYNKKYWKQKFGTVLILSSDGNTLLVKSVDSVNLY